MTRPLKNPPAPRTKGMQPAVRQNPNNALLAKLIDMVIDLQRDGDTRASRAEEQAQRAEERIQKAEKHAQKTEEKVEFLLQEKNIFCMDRLFLRQDELLFWLLIRGQGDLPWERTAEEVEKHVSRRLQVIAAVLHLGICQPSSSKSQACCTRPYPSNR